MTHWHSLYLWSEQTHKLVEAIQNYLEAHSYTSYNPFGLYPGMAYPVTVKTFIAPAQNGCIRVLFEGHEIDSLAAHLSHTADCLAIALDGTMPFVHFYRAGELIELTELKDYCRPNAESQLNAILSAETHDLTPINQEQIGDVPLDALPEDIQQMAKQVNAKQANKLFEKLKKQFIKAVGQYDAKVLLQSESDWNSQGGQYIRALMNCLRVPDRWREPDFSTLRHSFALQSRQQHDANTPLFPGDEDAIANIPNALDYVPVYGGKWE